MCVVGLHAGTVARVKATLAALSPPSTDPLAPPSPVPLALESFHVKRTDDAKDGALLLPKVCWLRSFRFKAVYAGGWWKSIANCFSK